ncbi:L-serine ammonia-lyase, iron-sulfur-dependent subunit beta [Clostridium sp. Cult2]|uniref:L-serine ammonia-lyase, iron-sulfur-dependent subunit beta n=1 Tax=Clostridium sp. Cult2 TaxID=2079003 RepID=UPI001F00E2BF|nr:L-serine ammonia-lyase, iron-sulfur-dependent subunit beta [Clostridium sp. Cult2]MCF6466689.1 L-serine ammonia-lyase, iron-sulfur-dependent, subunit beta [Clostridium sp. Cult2]
MKNYGVFDILGPVMIGPSSSHTAGATRLGKIGSEIADKLFNKVTFYLHGSFAKTYKGHGTDRALVAGILGMDPSDERIKDSLNIAKDKGIDIEFIEADLGYEHPNTVKIVFHYRDKDDYYITGSSIGGGNILITNINGNKVEFTGDYPTILIKYKDQKGSISRISSILSNEDINIATMKVSREGKIATMVMEIDSPIKGKIIDSISSLDEIIYITGINPIGRS